MNRRLVFVSACAAVLLVSVVAYGQQRGQGGRRGGGMGMMGRGMGAAMLLRNEAVQKELGISDEQKTKLQELAEANRPSGDRPDFGNMSQEERQKWMEERAKAAEEQLKKVGEVLDEKQMARMEEIRIQSLGTGAYMDEAVAKKLDITEEQQEKLRTAQREAFEALRDAAGEGERPNREAMAKMQEELQAKAKEILTEEQQAKFKELIGKPFDVAQLRGGMGGPGGGRGGRGGRGN